MPEELFIGLMSGTSVDGIDAVLVSFDSANRLRVIETLFTEFDTEIREKINQAAQNNEHLRTNQDSPLHQLLAPIYASACNSLLAKAGIPNSSISGIANHGQTVKHEPQAKPPYSLQLGDGQVIADLTGIKTYTQFRQADIIAGGQGAPLMPAFHKSIFMDNASENLEGKTPTSSDNVFILNIGGIANVTHLKEPLVGFDTGPGNVLLDQWIDQKFGVSYDKNGEWANQGQVDSQLLDNLLSDHYFAESHPKSTGTDYFNLAWLYTRHPALNSLAAQDVQATLVQLTVHSISDSILALGDSNGEVYICGGGANNPLIMQGLRSSLSKFQIEKTDALGVPSDWLEAIGFAWLGYCCAHDIVSNIPSVTGAKSKVVLGEIFLPR
ncbi:MAG: anhydro-N-acetylmuramic acid kinase [Arenicella sp.]|nr:anhydro-N-acetylmuramic acid kinase [Arenicella sp.]